MHQYGNPFFNSNAPERPRCWGKDYTTDSRECRGCTYGASCKDQIIRLNLRYTPNSVPNYAPTNSNPITTAPPFVPPPPPQPVTPITNSAPNFIPYNQNTAQQSFNRQPQPTQPNGTQAAVGQAKQSYSYPYGWLQDPLHTTIPALPPPVRPQHSGETFIHRASKNVFLAMTESFFTQCLLAVRQLVLPPNQRKD